MEQYFIAENNKQTGPFTKDELKSKHISKQTLVWKEGLEKWQNAETLDELKDCIMVLPPSLPTIPKQQFLSTEQKTSLKKSFWYFLLCFIPLYICIIWLIGGFSSGYDFEHATKRMGIYYDPDKNIRWIFFLIAGLYSLLAPTIIWIIAYSMIIYRKIISIEENKTWGDFGIIVFAIIIGILVITNSPNLDIDNIQKVAFSIILFISMLFVALLLHLWRLSKAINSISYTKALKILLQILSLILTIAIAIPYFVSNEYSWITFIVSSWLGLTVGLITSFIVFLWKQPRNSLSEIINKNNEQQKTPPINTEL